MNKLVVICGPTGVGKTKIAIELARRIRGQLVNADSRQVFKNMDIGTGKDLPVGAKPHESDINFRGEPVVYYDIEKVRIWGYDLADCHESFSVSDFINIGRRLVRKITSESQIPILVGGTGFYIDGLIGGFETANIPPDSELRKILGHMSVDDLYEHLAVLDPVKAAVLNLSDRKNARRLIRAIEVAQWRVDEMSGRPTVGLTGYSPVWIGLSGQRDVLEAQIGKRVRERIDKGMESEVRNLVNIGLGWDSQSMSALGYGLWKDYWDGRISLGELEDRWARDEIDYAKRQMAWFKRNKAIKWFDVTEDDLLSELEKCFV